MKKETKVTPLAFIADCILTFAISAALPKQTLYGGHKIPVHHGMLLVK